MVSNEGEELIMADKCGAKNSNLYKFKLDMVLATKDLWEIAGSSEAPPPSTANDKVRKAYKRQCKKAFAIIATSLVNKRLAHIKGCKRPTKT